MFRIFNDFIVKEVQAGSNEQLEKVMSALTEQEIRNVRRTSIMGITRLLIEKGRPEAAMPLIKYIEPTRSDQLLYFLEPLLVLNDLGLVEGELQDFCDAFQPLPAVVHSIIWPQPTTCRRGRPPEFSALVVGPFRR